MWGEEDVGKVRQEAKARLRVREGRAVKEVLRFGAEEWLAQVRTERSQHWRGLQVSEHSHRADGRVWIAGWSFSSVVVTSLMEKCRRQVVGMIPGGNPAKLGRSGVRGDGRAAETLALRGVWIWREK